MNKDLIYLLSNPLNEETKKKALHLISDSEPEKSPAFGFLENQDLVLNVSELAAGYVDTGTAAVSRQKTWKALYGATEISEALVELLENGAIINYTQAVMLVTMAMMSEDK